MSNLARTTITLPEHLYNQVKIIAASKGASFSSYVADVLELKVGVKKSKKTKTADPLSVLGRLSLGGKEPYKRRSELYEEHVKRKMGFDQVF